MTEDKSYIKILCNSDYKRKKNKSGWDIIRNKNRNEDN